ncbi:MULTISPECIES: hypothetical protein [unclassified Phenylobacterium]|uniref:hypothetical protein n=1 Tax=unclassified Phenylobacterium TaxID=2640670 RepID=UPI000AF9E99D|nr:MULTISPECIES: hypothetical protein [unclassified Phenylobacterium]
MPALQTAMSKLNASFCPGEIEKFAASNAAAFASGGKIDADLLTPPGTVLHRALDAYLDTLPGAFHETLRGILHYALSAQPPIPVTFAWAPGYDFELNIWQAPDAAETRGGVTVLIKSRYPADKHPLHK